MGIDPLTPSMKGEIWGSFVNAKAILGVAAIIGLAAGVASVPSVPTTPSRDAKLADVLKPDPVLEARFDASILKLRQIERAEREQTGEATDAQGAYSDYVSRVLSRGTTLQGAALLAGNAESPIASYRTKIAGAAYTQRAETAASTGISPASMGFDRSNTSRGHVERYGNPRSGSALEVETVRSVQSSASVPDINSGAIDRRSGQYYAPAGASGYVNTRDGTYYSRSDPNGVVDTRTGRYIPTN